MHCKPVTNSSLEFCFLLLPTLFSNYFRFETTDGTAKAVKDYLPTTGSVIFIPKMKWQQIEIPIVDNNKKEKNEAFNIKLSVNSKMERKVYIGKRETTEVIITNDDGKWDKGWSKLLSGYMLICHIIRPLSL